jgi:hypothetical protein
VAQKNPLQQRIFPYTSIPIVSDLYYLAQLSNKTTRNHSGVAGFAQQFVQLLV